MTTKVLLLTAAALLLVSSLLTGPGNALPSGAPEAACGNMMPLHNVSAQENPSPYTSAVTALGGTRYNFVLTAPAATPFKGVFIQAQDNVTSAIVGAFEGPATDMQFINCNMGTMNAATHINNNTKTRIEVVWNSGGATGTILFHYTTCQDVTTFWVHETKALP